jgi:glycosyltransferase involved in cell wall biosynthesis
MMNNNSIQQNNFLTLNRPMRALHLTSQLGYGGVDAWLMNLLRLQRPEIQFEFVVTRKGCYDDEARSLGSVIHHIRKGFGFSWHKEDLRSILSKGKYDVLHAHTSELGCYVLKLAAEYDIPVRIVHSHNCGTNNPWKLKTHVSIAYHHLFGLYYCNKYASSILACSYNAGEFFFRHLWKKFLNKSVIYCGISDKLFDMIPDYNRREQLCNFYGIPNDAHVIGYVGRLSYQKNIEFLLDIFAELSKRNNNYILFIAGDGELRPNIERRIEYLGLKERVVLPGICSNIPELMCQLFDIFCLPSRFEGIPLVLMESMCAGLYSICSNVITTEITDTIPDRFAPMSLSSSIATWCNTIEEGIKKKISPFNGITLIKQTPFTIETSFENLLKIYKHDLNRAGIHLSLNDK